MQTFLPRHRRALSTGTALVGAFVLYWSVSALRSASHTPDRFLLLLIGVTDWNLTGEVSR